MKSLTGFWAGQYNYSSPNYPIVKFDCELTQTGPSVTGQITETDIYKPSAMFLLEAIVEGQIHKGDFCFTKTYLTKSDIYNQPVEYVGKVSLSGNRISGRWFIGLESGIFKLKRDKGSSLSAKSRIVANDTIVDYSN